MYVYIATKWYWWWHYSASDIRMSTALADTQISGIVLQSRRSCVYYNPVSTLYWVDGMIYNVQQRWYFLTLHKICTWLIKYSSRCLLPGLRPRPLKIKTFRGTKHEIQIIILSLLFALNPSKFGISVNKTCLFLKRILQRF